MPQLIKITDYTRNDFETIITANKKTLPELIAMQKKGRITEDEYLFPLESVIAICESVARGFYNHAAVQESPRAKWSLTKKRPDLVRSIISEVFT